MQIRLTIKALSPSHAYNYLAKSVSQIKQYVTPPTKSVGGVFQIVN
ncbi:MAG: hypothetical protein ACTHY0_01535 [Mammaliicoccus vitulinus]